MIKNIEITNYLGETLKIPMESPNNTGLLISSIEGLGPPKANINFTDNAMFDGSQYQSAKAENRNIVINFIFDPDYTQESIETVRQKTYKYFPIKKMLKFVIETDEQVLYTYGYVESNEPDIFQERTSSSISIMCPNSYFYTIYNNELLIHKGIQPLFSFPFSNKYITIPTIKFNSLPKEHPTQEIYYEGTVSTGVYISIYLYADVGDITITNIQQNENFIIRKNSLFEGTAWTTYLSGDLILIDTHHGVNKIEYVRENEMYNGRNALGRNVNWLTLDRGLNTIRYDVRSAESTAESGIENVDISLTYETLQEGV